MTMLQLLLFLMVFLLPCGAQAGGIIGGREAWPHSRPYMALVSIEPKRKAESICGGFLIRQDVVVTAAHCNCNLGNITVLLGAHNVAEKEPTKQLIPVRHRVPHPEFNDEMIVNDIMLLQLRHKAQLTWAVETLPLSQRKVKEGVVCSVAGWGRTGRNARPSLTLQEVDLKVMREEVCLSRPYLHFMPAKMLCVGDPQVMKASFRGDSGGPLVCDGKAQGIVSYGRPDGLAPRVFTKLSKYVPWIKKTLRKLRP